MASESRRTVLYIGLAYIVAFFAVRLLSGFAIFSVIQLPGISRIFTFIAAAVALIAGIIQVVDGLSKKQKPLLSIPDSKKGLISSYMKKASIPAGLVVGALVGVYGMACTAGIYISILGMLYKEPAIGLIYLVLYNVVVIIPLLIILLLVFFGIPPEKVNSWRDEQKSMLRVLIGVVMIIMGIIILIPMI
jgi:cytochrome c biogenesis protein CcdA